jgi:integrase/recombinase XerC
MPDKRSEIVAFSPAPAGTALDPSPSMIAQVVRNFMAGFAPNSRVTMRYALRRIADDLGMGSDKVPIDGLPWHRVTASEFSELLFVWRETLDVSTIRLYMHALRGVARACYVHGLMPSEQFVLLKEVKLPRGRNKSGRGRSVEQQYRNALLADCQKDDRVQGLRDAALIALLFASGLRRAELAGVLADNLNLDEGEVKVKAKGGDTVVRYFAAWAIPYLRRWIEYRSEQDVYGGPLFTRISKAGKLGSQKLTGRGVFYLLETRSKRAGLPFLVRPHDGRRTIGTDMIAEHGELIAQRVLGHADLSTTRIYDMRKNEVVKEIFKNRTEQ